MTTVASGSTRTFTATRKGQTFTLISQTGTYVTVSGDATSRHGPSPRVRTFGPFEAGQSIAVQSELGDTIVETATSDPTNKGSAAPISSPWRAAAAMGIAGDSRASQSVNKATVPYTVLQAGLFGLALSLSGQCVTVPDAGWQCVGGQRVTTGTATADTAPLSLQMDNLLALGVPNITIAPMGANDFDSTLGPLQTVAVVTAAYFKEVKKAIAAGVQLWLCTDTGVRNTEAVATSKARQISILLVNAWIRSLAIAYPQQVRVIDLHAALVATNSATASPATAGYFDAIHLNSIHNYAAAKVIAAAWNVVFPVAPVFPANNYEDTSYDSTMANKLPNALFLVDTNADGIADQWTAQLVSSGITSVMTVAAAPAPGIGNAQHIVVTAANAGFVKWQTADLIAAMPNGSTFVIVGKVKLTSGTNCSAPRVQPTANVNVGGAACLDFGGSFQAAMPADDVFTYITHPITKDATMTTLKVEVALQFLAAGGATLDLMQFGLIVLPTQPQ